MYRAFQNPDSTIFYSTPDKSHKESKLLKFSKSIWYDI